MNNNNKTNHPARLIPHRQKRLKAIEEYIASGMYPTRQKLADLLQVRVETIKKDIAVLRAQGQPIDHCPKNGGYYHSKEFTGMLSVHHVTIDEILALETVERACSTFDETLYAKRGSKTIRKIIESFVGNVAYPKGWQNIVSFHTSNVCVFDPVIFSALFDAGSRRYEVTVLYRKPGPGNHYELRTLDVHHIAKIDTEYFVFAYDVMSGKMRTFIPARMKDVKKTGKKFKRKKFNIYDRLKYSFHVYDGEPCFEAIPKELFA